MVIKKDDIINGSERVNVSEFLQFIEITVLFAAILLVSRME